MKAKVVILKNGVSAKIFVLPHRRLRAVMAAVEKAVEAFFGDPQFEGYGDYAVEITVRGETVCLVYADYWIRRTLSLEYEDKAIDALQESLQTVLATAPGVAVYNGIGYLANQDANHAIVQAVLTNTPIRIAALVYAPLNGRK